MCIRDSYKSRASCILFSTVPYDDQGDRRINTVDYEMAYGLWLMAYGLWLLVYDVRINDDHKEKRYPVSF